MKVHEFTGLEKKLGLKTQDTHHHYAWLEYNGETVVRTKRSQGKGKFIPEDKIRKQLHVNQAQFQGLISCYVSKDDYIKILIEKGIIAAPAGESKAATARKNATGANAVAGND